jgi:hypothetical protein
VARRASKDPGSSPSGGDLGTIHEGQMVRSFETAIFAAATGEVTEPFRSEFGWHLAYVTRRGERRVAEVCRGSIEKAASTAGAYDKEGLSLGLMPFNRSTMGGRIAALLGDDWRGPFADKDANPFYLKSEPASPSDLADLRIVTVHTEFTLARFVATEPMACARSMRQQWVVDCRSPGATGMASMAEFEGRAAAGRRTMDVGPGPQRATLDPVQAGTLGSWLVNIACRPPAAKLAT